MLVGGKKDIRMKLRYWSFRWKYYPVVSIQFQIKSLKVGKHICVQRDRNTHTAMEEGQRNTYDMKGLYQSFLALKMGERAGD
jgi:hypothetical protein